MGNEATTFTHIPSSSLLTKTVHPHLFILPLSPLSPIPSSILPNLLELLKIVGVKDLRSSSCIAGDNGELFKRLKSRDATPLLLLVEFEVKVGGEIWVPRFRMVLELVEVPSSRVSFWKTKESLAFFRAGLLLCDGWRRVCAVLFCGSLSGDEEERSDDELEGFFLQ